jgi:hypothetical protein
MPVTLPPQSYPSHFSSAWTMLIASAWTDEMDAFRGCALSPAGDPPGRRHQAAPAYTWWVRTASDRNGSLGAVTARQDQMLVPLCVSLFFFLVEAKNSINYEPR